jgi:hypothetical protein
MLKMKSEYLPSKKFMQVVSALILTTSIGGVLYVMFRNDPQVESPETLIQIVRSNEKDTDNDGLKDWEEDLWGTDKNNPDTDGDGVPDGQEVRENRDPLIPGPRDIITNFQKKNLYQIPTTESLSNRTTVLFNTSFPDALILADRIVKGENVSQEEIQLLLADYEVSTTTPNPVFDISRITIQPTTDYVAYIESVVSILQTYSSHLGNELEIVSAGLQNKDPNTLLSLRSTALRYEALARELMLIPTPRTLVNEHLAVANAYGQLSGSVIYLSSITIDPFQGLIAIRDYSNLSEIADEAITFLLLQTHERARESVQ